jgi:hypothetical protein
MKEDMRRAVHRSPGEQHNGCDAKEARSCPYLNLSNQFHAGIAAGLGTAEIERTGAGIWRLDLYPLPRALRTLSGVAGDSTHLPIALWIAMITRCVFVREWLMPLPP